MVAWEKGEESSCEFEKGWLFGGREGSRSRRMYIIEGSCDDEYIPNFEFRISNFVAEVKEKEGSLHVII